MNTSLETKEKFKENQKTTELKSKPTLSIYKIAQKLVLNHSPLCYLIQIWILSIKFCMSVQKNLGDRMEFE